MNGMNTNQQAMLEGIGTTVNNMFQYMIESMEAMKKEIQDLKRENKELKLNIISMNPMYSNEQRAMAAQQLMEMQDSKKSSLADTFK